MSDSVILNIKSWRSSEDYGRKHLAEINPQFVSTSSYSYEEKIINATDTLTVSCGKYFTFIWTDKIVNYSINSGRVMHGQIIMLSDNTTGSSILITGTLASTKVSYISVN